MKNLQKDNDRVNILFGVSLERVFGEARLATTWWMKTEYKTHTYPMLTK